MGRLGDVKIYPFGAALLRLALRRSVALSSRQAMKAVTHAQLRPPPRPYDTRSLKTAEQLLIGVYNFEGQTLYDGGRRAPWHLSLPNTAYRDELHAFAWLDDFAALNTPPAREQARLWLEDWQKHYGHGQKDVDLVWRFDLVAARLERLLRYCPALHRGASAEICVRLNQLLDAHRRYVLRHSQKTRQPLSIYQLKAMSWAICAGYALENTSAISETPRALALLTLKVQRFFATGIEAALTGHLPQVVLDFLIALDWLCLYLEAGQYDTPPDLKVLLHDARGILSKLRHKNGDLPRFRYLKDGAGDRGRLDRFLVRADGQTGMFCGLGRSDALGYTRLIAGRCSVILDHSPVNGASSKNRQQGTAAALSLEIVSGACPLIVSNGLAAPFFVRPHLAHYSHDAMNLSALFLEQNVEAPSQAETPPFTAQEAGIRPVSNGFSGLAASFKAGHWYESHGLIYERHIRLEDSGARIFGQEILYPAPSCPATFQIETFFTVRFHLHPQTRVSVYNAGRSALIALENGHEWHFTVESGMKISIEPSAYHDVQGLQPLPSAQIVLRGPLSGGDIRTKPHVIGWTFTQSPISSKEYQTFGASGAYSSRIRPPVKAT